MAKQVYEAGGSLCSFNTLLVEALSPRFQGFEVVTAIHVVSWIVDSFDHDGVEC